ncbi:MAG: glycosyltransferase family 9 protein [Bacteroidota bacterium]|nr:glycosyltransferase family 9 protein [Bacteroidota bacterium]
MATILITRFSALGDVAISVPLVRALANSYPGCTFIMVSQPSMAGLFEDCPSNLLFIPARIRDKHKGISGLYQLYKELSVRHIDLICDIHDVHRSRILCLFFAWKRIPIYRINKERAKRRLLTRQKHKVLTPLKTSFQRYLEVFEKAGFVIREEDIFAQMPRPDSSLDEIEKKYGRKTGCWLGIAPFARHTGKSYPFERMKEVIAHFAMDERYNVFLFGGGEKERSLMAGLKQVYPTIHVPDTRNLNEDIYLMNCLDILVTMDSANMHLGALANTTVVSIWGATHPYAGFSGLFQQASNQLQIDMLCRPCSIYGNKPCFRNDYACLNGISPALIIQKIETLSGL